MAEAANYTVVYDSAVTLPDRSNPNPDTDFEYGKFGAPGLSSSTALTDRPYLEFSVDPAGVCALELELNGTVVVSEAFGVGDTRTVSEVIDHGDLQPSENTLIVRSLSGAIFTISDLKFAYKVNI